MLASLIWVERRPITEMEEQFTHSKIHNERVFKAEYLPTIICFSLLQLCCSQVRHLCKRYKTGTRCQQSRISTHFTSRRLQKWILQIPYNTLNIVIV